MRVRSVSIIGHPGLGDLEIDLCEGPESPAPRTVVVAGENGTGKTVLLETIHNALAPEPAFIPGRSVTVVLDLDASFSGLTAHMNKSVPPADFDTARPVTIRLELPVGGPFRRTVSWTSRSGQEAQVEGPMYPQPPAGGGPRLLRPMFPVLFSEAAVGFDVPPITALRTTGPSEEDGVRVGRQAPKGGRDLGRDITKLLLDLRAADAADLQRWVERHPSVAPPVDLPNRRWKGFSEAFSSIFPRKRLVSSEETSAGHRVLFEEDGRQCTIDTLSTGEKQIVFRGGYLLRYADAVPGALVLMDEPELSLHPKWQSRILDFYDRLANPSADAGGQLILATHSPFVVHGSPLARRVVLSRGADGRVTAMRRPTFAGTTDDVAITAFDLDGFLAGLQGRSRPLLLVEGASDRDLVLEAWRRRRHGRDMPFEIWPAGGASAVNTLLRQQAMLDRFARRGSVLVGLFDFDAQGVSQWNGVWDKKLRTEIESDPSRGLTLRHPDATAWAMLLPVPAFRTTYANRRKPNLSVLEMEHLFRDEKLQGFVEQEQGPGGMFSSVPDCKKAAFALAASLFDDADFASFDIVFERLESVLTGSANAAQPRTRGQGRHRS